MKNAPIRDEIPNSNHRYLSAIRSTTSASNDKEATFFILFPNCARIRTRDLLLWRPERYALDQGRSHTVGLKVQAYIPSRTPNRGGHPNLSLDSISENLCPGIGRYQLGTSGPHTYCRSVCAF